ncbi:MAG: amidohydrolase [Eubacteriales bacterium]|nr:amidohydrolase [Eubacteriales bacterium]
MIDFKSLAKKNHRYTVEMRRYFHEHPELSQKEVNTAKKICEELEKMGIPHKEYEDYTVIATIDSGKPGKTILIRGDIDALPVTEATGLPFASKNPGVMHACGHDCHGGMLLGMARSLNEVKDQLTGKILLGFQVAEENLKGSRTMVQYVKDMGGADNSIAIHVGCGEDTNTVTVIPGPMASGVVTYKTFFYGRGGHGSAPHNAIDPIKPACEYVLKLAALPTSQYDAKDPIVFSTCTIMGGSGAPNVIPDQSYVFGTVRYFNKSLTEKIMNHIRDLASAVASTYGCTSSVEWTYDPMIPVENDRHVTEVCQGVARKLGLKMVTEGMGMGSDDMALLVDAFPGCYMNLGCGNEEKGTKGLVNHAPNFTVDEDALETGCEFMMECAYALLND